MPNAWKIAKETGITLHSRKDRGAHPGGVELWPRHSWSPNAVYRAAVIAEKGGKPEQVYDVLTLLIAAEHNATQLYEDVIIGTALWARGNGVQSAEVPFLAPAFNEVSLQFIRQEVSSLHVPRRPERAAQILHSMMKDGLGAIRS